MSSSELSPFYVNHVKVLQGLHEFYLDLGVTLPFIITSMEDVEKLDEEKPHIVFRCVMPPSVAKQLADILQELCEQQAMLTRKTALTEPPEGTEPSTSIDMD